ncbi:MAG: hypothetical protein HYY60_00545 [Parcubacteria group bacterium]|nr:hypothetical protein [Parcubacteria group bacterium]
MSGLYREGAMTEEARRLKAEDDYRAAVRNLSPAQIALVETTILSPKEEREISASGQMSYAREKFLELQPRRERPLSPFCGLENS